MTSDAKIGLLLGLVFIFIIAFIINGLPAFRGGGDKDNSELTRHMTSSQKETIGIPSARFDAIGDGIDRLHGEVRNERVSLPADSSKARHEMEVPQSPVVEVPKAEQLRVESDPPSSEDRKQDKTIKPATPKVYIVVEGDNLSAVAKKFYGQQEGNKIENIERIYQANRHVLKSVDEIYAGQKITIPPVQASGHPAAKVQDAFPNGLVEPVESVGRRHLLGPPAKAAGGKQYVVREGDSLWRIAAEQLGDGNRYREIARLNAGILENENVVLAGMRLNLPVR